MPEQPKNPSSTHLMPNRRTFLAATAMAAGACLGVPTARAAENDALWQASAPLLTPRAGDYFDNVAVKDPTIVRFEGRWHLVYTARGTNGYGLGYVSADALDRIEAAPRHPLAQLDGPQDYAAAPQLFFFRPQETWYLIYQTRAANYQPVYSTNKHLGDPAGWSPPQPLVAKEEAAKWIDFWIICDSERAYLFFTRNHKTQYAMHTPRGRFPEGFGDPQPVFGPLHEAAHVYRVAGTATYHMLYETRLDNEMRRFGLAKAPAPLGPWETVTEDYARGEQAAFRDGAAPWTAEVSHGEFLRAGYDERMLYDPNPARLLIQGIEPGKHTGPYPELPWRLGLLTRER